MKINQHKLREFKFTGFNLLGYSVAGEESVFIIPEFNLAFDIGKCPIEALGIDHVLLTHGHLDHAAGLPYYFAQRYFQSQKQGIALVPLAIAELLEDLMNCWCKIDGCKPEYKIIGMSHGDEFELNRHLFIRAFTTNHVIPSLGFSVIEVRHKLKAEFKSAGEKQLIELKKQNIAVTQREEIPLVAYLGDTAMADYAALPHVANAKLLLMECTFFRDDQVERTHKYKHLHVSDLANLLAGMHNQHIIITHVTKSVGLAEAKEILRNNLPPEILQRVSFFMG